MKRNTFLLILSKLFWSSVSSRQSKNSRWEGMTSPLIFFSLSGACLHWLLGTTFHLRAKMWMFMCVMGQKLYERVSSGYWHILCWTNVLAKKQKKKKKPLCFYFFTLQWSSCSFLPLDCHLWVNHDTTPHRCSSMWILFITIADFHTGDVWQLHRYSSICLIYSLGICCV